MQTAPVVPETAGPNHAASSDLKLRQLLGTYRAVEQLEPWVVWSVGWSVGWSDKSQPASALTLELASLKAAALAALAADRVVGPRYDVVIEGGVVDAEGGGDLGPSVNAPRLGTTSAFVRLEVETAHLDIGAGWDAGLGFQVGWQPMLTMTTSASRPVLPAYRDGFTTSQSFRFAKSSSTTETAIVGRVGATRLSLAPVLDRNSSPNQLFAIADNGIAEWALVFDAGVDFRWYDRDVWLEHLAAQTLEPLVDVHVGLRHDQRFHRAGDLSEFDDPTGRLVFGFMVNPIRITDRGAGGIGNTRLTFGGGFEFEGALRGPTRLPSGFRIVLAGRLDLPRAWTAGK
ncbi:MAG: hypothetical protein ABJA98_10080 [Acidobacteriota bacterium]